MKVVHRIEWKVITSFVLIVFASLQILPQGFAKQLPVEVQTQSQVSTQPVESVVSAEDQIASPRTSQTSIDFIAESKSPLSVPKPIVLTPDILDDVEPIPNSETVVPIQNALEEPVNEPQIDPSLLRDGNLSTGELIKVELPEPEEIIPIGEPLEPGQPFPGNAGAYFEVIQEETKEPERSGSESISHPRKRLSQYLDLAKRRFRPLDRKKTDQVSPRDEQGESKGSSTLWHKVVRNLKQAKSSASKPDFRLNRNNRGQAR